MDRSWRLDSLQHALWRRTANPREILRASSQRRKRMRRTKHSVKNLQLAALCGRCRRSWRRWLGRHGWRSRWRWWRKSCRSQPCHQNSANEHPNEADLQPSSALGRVCRARRRHLRAQRRSQRIPAATPTPSPFRAQSGHFQRLRKLQLRLDPDGLESARTGCAAVRERS